MEMTNPTFFLILATLVFANHVTSLAGKDANCVISEPCECAFRSVIQCSFRNVTSVPLFISVSYPIDQIHLQRNNIKSIEAGAFKNLTFAKRLELWLDYNPLVNIDDMAFDGLQNQTLSLYLDGTKLKKLPKALTLLNSLERLQINCPLDKEVMMIIGPRLTFLIIDELKQWPPDIRYADKLTGLQLRGNGTLHFPDDAFLGIESSLQTLYFYEFAFDQPLNALCNLTTLNELSLNFVDITATDGILPNCSIPSLRSFTLYDSGLLLSPDISAAFPFLEFLALTHTKVSLVPQTLPPTIKTLDLGYGNLTHIPSVVATLRNLDSLWLGGNYITNLPRNSLPKNLHNDLTVNLAGNPFQCSCELLWLLQWEKLRNHSLNFRGQCAHRMQDISEYLSDEINAKCEIPVG